MISHHHRLGEAGRRAPRAGGSCWRRYGLRGCALIAFVAGGCRAAAPPAAPEAPATPEAPAASEQPRGVLFDDFAYADQSEMKKNGWVVRTAAGLPGVPGATWWKEGVSFVDDPAQPGNRLLQLTSSTAGDGASTKQIQLCHERKYLEGTYAARVHFRDEPDSGPDGDQIVETFYAITPPSEPDYSELDFEYLANGGWGFEKEVIYATTWTSWGVVRPKTPDAEFEHDMTTGTLKGSQAGWHTLLAQVQGGTVKYSVDGRVYASHGKGYYPRAAMSINFNLWFVAEGVLESKDVRQYTEQVDWVYHEANAVLTLEEVEQRVAELRRSATPFQDTVPAWSPPLPSPCDL